MADRRTLAVGAGGGMIAPSPIDRDRASICYGREIPPPVWTEIEAAWKTLQDEQTTIDLPRTSRDRNDPDRYAAHHRRMMKRLDALTGQLDEISADQRTIEALDGTLDAAFGMNPERSIADEVEALRLAARMLRLSVRFATFPVSQRTSPEAIRDRFIRRVWIALRDGGLAPTLSHVRGNDEGSGFERLISDFGMGGADQTEGGEAEMCRRATDGIR